MVALHYWSFELFPLNELYRGKACALKNSYTLGDILMIFSIHVYHVKMVCHMQEWLLSLAGLLSSLALMDFIGDCFCAQ